MVIDIQHITKDYGQNRGVFDVSFGVDRGEVMGFLGPNGAGKTTTIRQLMGFIRPDSGQVGINGLDCFAQAEAIQSTLGYLPGEIAFIDGMTGDAFIHFIARMKKMRQLGRIDELKHMLALDASGRIKKMSKGMKQKIGIVCAFMHDPDILILDEPTSGLDPLMQDVFVDLIRQEKQKGKTILMSSHDFEEVERTCDRAAIIKQGRIVAVENVEHLRQNRQRIYIAQFGSAEEASSFAAEAFDCDLQGATATIRVTQDVDALIKALAKYHVVKLDMQVQTLEQLFMHFYGGGATQ